MKKGTYYIGDPCYIFNKSWEKVLKETDYFDKNRLFNKEICGGSTAFGDGRYKDNSGREYSVDSGLIAILPVSLLSIDKEITRKDVENSKYLHIVKMKEDFECETWNGVFTFGDIIINTREDDEEEDDE